MVCAFAAKKIAAKSAGTKAPASKKIPDTKMTKTQLLRFMAEEMEVPPKQVAGFFNLLIQTATAQTRKLGEFTIPRFGQAGEGYGYIGGPGMYTQHHVDR